MKRVKPALMLFLIAGALLWAALPGSSQAPATQRPTVQAQAEQDTPYTEEEYDAYEKATKEPDLDKREAMLWAFIDKYPKSTLLSYITPALQTLMYEYEKAGKWGKLIPLAERWLKTHPDDIQAWAYITEGAQKLGQDQKFLEYGQKIYEQKPTPSLALYIYQTYKKLNDEPKTLEWAEKMFGYDEFAGEFRLRMLFVQKYLDEKKFDKAASYAEQALKSLAAAKKPDSVSEAEWTRDARALRKVCNYVIGVNYYDKERFGEAIRSLETSLKAERWDYPYYYIGMSLWKIGRVEEAIDAFAKVVVMSGPAAGQAKGHLENLYKGLHNDTLIGIEKVYRKAKLDLGMA